MRASSVAWNASYTGRAERFINRPGGSQGDLDVVRDRGYASDYVDAMWRMMQLPSPEDFIVGTGVPHTVRDLCQAAFGAVDLDFTRYVWTDLSLQRPGQPTRPLANPDHARRALGWSATTGFHDLVRMLVTAQAICRSGELRGKW